MCGFIVELTVQWVYTVPIDRTYLLIDRTYLLIVLLIELSEIFVLAAPFFFFMYLQCL